MEVDERISVRFEGAEVKAMDDIIAEYGYPNRSEFIRNAIRSHMSSQQQKNSVTVEVSALLLEFIDALVERKYYISRESAIQKAIESHFTEDITDQALKAAESMEIGAGKKIKVDMDTPTQQIK